MVYEKSGLIARRRDTRFCAAIVIDDLPKAIGFSIDTMDQACLTAEEARFLANLLLDAALRLEKRLAEDT